MRRFNAYLALIASAGLGLRLAYLYGPSVTSVSGDGSWYHLGAKYLADGKGFINPYEHFFYGVTTPGAEHPPAWTAVLAVTSKLGLGSFRAHTVVACVIGAATIVVIGFVGRRLAGRRAGLIAATLAAVYVNLWMYESMLLSETLVIFGVGVTFLVALCFSESPSISRAVALGAVVGAMALIRAEQILLFGFLLVPLTLIARADSMQQRLRRLGAALVTAVVVVAPWVAYNAGRFEERTYLTTSFGRTFFPGNCEPAYYGPSTGAWLEACMRAGTDRVAHLRATSDPQDAARIDDSTIDRELTDMGVDYARHHASRVPVVVLAREGRTWGIFRPFQQLELDLVDGNINVLRAGLVMYWLLAALAIAGVWQHRKQRHELVIFGAFVATVTVATAITVGQTRIRAPAEVGVVLFAGVAFDALLRRASSRPTPETVRRPQADDPAVTATRVRNLGIARPPSPSARSPR